MITKNGLRFMVWFASRNNSERRHRRSWRPNELERRECGELPAPNEATVARRTNSSPFLERAIMALRGTPIHGSQDCMLEPGQPGTFRATHARAPNEPMPARRTNPRPRAERTHA